MQLVVFWWLALSDLFGPILFEFRPYDFWLAALVVAADLFFTRHNRLASLERGNPRTAKKTIAATYKPTSKVVTVINHDASAGRL
jgi:hypothetical protein